MRVGALVTASPFFAKSSRAMGRPKKPRATLSTTCNPHCCLWWALPGASLQTISASVMSCCRPVCWILASKHVSSRNPRTRFRETRQQSGKCPEHDVRETQSRGEREEHPPPEPGLPL